MKSQVITLHEDRNVTLTVYLQGTGGEFHLAKRPGVLVLPGGGYQYCSDREADPVAFPYLKAGCQVFILRYSVGADSVWPTPLEDYEEAISLIREKSDEWGVWEDKIAVIGFSAGGHLAAAAATMAKNRPNAAILGYAVATEDVKGCNPSAPDTVAEIDDLTPPCFLFHTRTDGLVPVSNSIRFMGGLAEKGISFESHIYAYGPHGFSTCDSSVQSAGTKITPRVRNWVSDSIGWLKEVFGEFEGDRMGEPEISSHVNDNHLPYLTVDCTLGHIMANPQAAAMIGQMMAQSKGKSGVEVANVDPEMGLKMVYGSTLRDVLGFMRPPKEMIEALDQQLRQITV